MPAISTSTKREGGGLATKLFNKFDSDRKYDPFLDMDPVIKDSKEGMEALLSMCNAVEINSLFAALGFVVPCPRKAKEQQIMNYIREGGRQVQKKFADVLKFCWEGLLFEYLRTVGCPLRDREHDPRHFVMRYWRRSMLDPSVQPGFVPFYAKREIKRRNTILQEDRDIRDIRAGLILREDRVKDSETKTRGQHDYRFVLQYFSASRDLHRTLVANVDYLASEVEQLRANMDHKSESISIMEEQFVELETKYDRVVGGLVHREAFQLTLESTLYRMISESHAALKTAERMANEVLDSMDTGPWRYDVVASAYANDNTPNNKHLSIRNASPTQGDVEIATSRSDLGSATSHETIGRQSLEGKTETSDAAEDSEENVNRTWAAPRARGGPHKRLRNSSSSGTSLEGNTSRDMRPNTSTGAHFVVVEDVASPAKTSEEAFRSHSREDGRGVRVAHRHLLEPCLGQVLEIHRRACRRYGNQIVELEGQNAALISRAAEASRLEGEATAQTRSWEVKHGALEQQLADLEKRSREELACAEERAEEARALSLEVADLLRAKLERATPILLDMVTVFSPRDTEVLGVDLLRSLGIEPDLYAHIIARKMMFKADMESRAFEIIDAERKKALAEAEAAELEAAAVAAAGGGGAGKKKKGERGRPKSKGKGGGGADKGKSGGSKSKSRSKSAPAKEAKTTAQKGGSKAGGGAGKDKKSAGKAKNPSSADKKRATSPAKKGGTDKGNKKRQ